MEAAEISKMVVIDYLKRRVNLGEVSDWTEGQFAMPQVPYSAWFQDGTRFIYRIPSDVRTKLVWPSINQKYYRAGRILDGIALWNVRPDVRRMAWAIIGTQIGSGGAPSLSYWVDRLYLGVVPVAVALPDYRALVLGREIRTLELAA